ncbi:5689_t:CDS:2 [Racocetra fulgida]|uniref:5689_t:CDS:1 n=1 Tax=Racocetra fulgida TaxID=60492 RepID=A0A9N8VLC3_9GLOM|nr:5689_t:CDS:2 [Racocetra fulgida]
MLNSSVNFKNEYVDRLTQAMVWKPANPITTNNDNPPTPYDLTLASLLSAGLHIGHSKSLWNPKTSPFIFGIRHGISIINLDHTLIYLRRACKVTREISYRGGIILFINTRGGGFALATINAAKRCNQFQLTTRWLPGTITNSQQILGHLMPKEPNEILPKVFKPDLIILLNPLENTIVLEEAKHGNVPTIGIIDTDFDPQKVSWPIPANDDSVRGVELIAGVLSMAARDGLIHRRKIMEKIESQRIKTRSTIVKVSSKTI